MGAANFFTGRIGRLDGMEAEVILDSGQTIRATGVGGASPGHELRLVVRPEKITISTSEAAIPPRHTNRLAATVLQTVFMGSSMVYRVRSGSSEISVYQQNQDPIRPAEGEAVWLSWLPADTIPVKS
jgi:ABC-type Fe3+/spermidine/putrescine transport system ATPase subunit